MHQNLFAKFVCPSPKVLDFRERRLHWASVVRFTQILQVFFVKELQIDFFCETIITNTVDAKFTFMEGSKSLQQTQN